MAVGTRTVLIPTQPIVLVHARFVVSRMAARAGGLVTWRRPADEIAVARVAPGTSKITAVIERFIRQACMAVINRRPGNRVVAQTAVLCSIEVSRVHAGGQGAVVAGRTGSKNLVVIHGENRRPDSRGMAGFADVGRLNMRRALAGGVRAVMTAEAVVHDVRMVKIRRYPCDCCVTVVAIVAAGDVGRVFADRRNAIVTRAADADYLRVVYGVCGHPRIRVMAVFANVACLNMRKAFACGIGAVVATKAVARDIDVIEICG